MLMTRERRPGWREIDGWAIRLLLAEGAIRRCPDHGFMQCRGNPDARAHACAVAAAAPLPGLTPAEAVAALNDVLGSCGDTCPAC